MAVLRPSRHTPDWQRAHRELVLRPPRNPARVTAARRTVTASRLSPVRDAAPPVSRYRDRAQETCRDRTTRPSHRRWADRHREMPALSPRCDADRGTTRTASGRHRLALRVVRGRSVSSCGGTMSSSPRELVRHCRHRACPRSSESVSPVRRGWASRDSCRPSRTGRSASSLRLSRQPARPAVVAQRARKTVRSKRSDTESELGFLFPVCF